MTNREKNREETGEKQRQTRSRGLFPLYNPPLHSVPQLAQFEPLLGEQSRTAGPEAELSPAFDPEREDPSPADPLPATPLHHDDPPQEEAELRGRSLGSR